MTETPARDWLRPRVRQLLADAAAEGIAQDVAIAVLTDLLDSEFNQAPLAADPGLDRDPGEPEAPPADPEADALAADADLPIGAGDLVHVRSSHGWHRGL